MAIFRIEKTRDYTVMSNAHLKDQRMSLKSKGLLSMILSLPDEWNYTIRGLASICKEGRDSISGALQEMEMHGYLERNQLRDERGRITDTEYVIYEQPRPHNPKPDNPEPVLPDTDFPNTVKSVPEKSPQLNTNQANKNKSKTNLSNIHQSISGDEIDTIRKIIKENIDYEFLEQSNPTRLDELEEIVELMLEVMTTTKSHIRIGGENKPREVVKSRFMKITAEHIEYVITAMSDNTTDVRNIKSYLITSIYNAPTTIGNYYQAKVNHDLYGQR